MIAQLFKYYVLGHDLDTREPYLLSRRGRPLGLFVLRNENHENYIHDGTPHQNPVVYKKWVNKYVWGFKVGWERIQVSEYPLTVSQDGRYADLNKINQLVKNSKTNNVYVGALTNIKKAYKVENATQKAKGVAMWALKRYANPNG